MRQMAVLLLAVLCAIELFSGASIEVPRVLCRDSAECGTNQCCLLGRYVGSEPQCQTAPQEDDVCRPHQVASNATIYDTDGKPMYNVTNVYIDVCPCAEGLSCDPNSGGVCKKST